MALRGARVTLVTGAATAALRNPLGRIERVQTLSAEEMYRACAERFPQMDGAVFCAAVADYTPAHPMTEKYKHEEGKPFLLELAPTHDIAAEMGRVKRPGQITFGFALETSAHAEEYARHKLDAKNLDVVVLNSLRDPGAGFGTDTNKVTLIDRDAETAAVVLPLLSKEEVAAKIADRMAEKFNAIRTE